MSEPPIRFRGSLVATRWTRGVWWDIIDVDAERVVMHPWIRRSITVLRSEVRTVEFQPMRVPPFAWQTNVVFRRNDGSTADKLFNPWRTKRFRAALERLGWPCSAAVWPGLIDRKPFRAVKLTRRGRGTR